MLCANIEYIQAILFIFNLFFIQLHYEMGIFGAIF